MRLPFSGVDSSLCLSWLDVCTSTSASLPIGDAAPQPLQQPQLTGRPGCRFIQRDLAGVNRSVTPWIVVNLHRPIYTSSMFGRDQQSDIVVGADLRSALEDLFFTYQVASWSDRWLWVPGRLLLMRQESSCYHTP